MRLRVFCSLVWSLAVFVFMAIPSHAGALRAGAARLDITPGPDEALPMSGYAARKEGHKGIRDRLHVRAVVFDDGRTQTAILSADLIDFSHEFVSRMSQRIRQETGVSREKILIIGTHTHSAPSPGAYEPVAPDSAQAAYIRRVEEGMIQTVLEAQRGIQPARIGYGTGRANVNVNRRALMADGSWWLGINPDGPSDKTVGVVKVETMSGEPVAILINYGVHGTGMGQENYQISGDIPGAASRWVEEQSGGMVVAPWISGAGGDQCPIYDRSASRFDGVEAIGRILGQEVMRVAGGIKTSSEVTLRGAQKVVSCPGRRLISERGRHREFEFADADPVNIRLSLIRINDLALAGVSGELFTGISQQIKQQSPLPQTIVIAHCNGASGYLPDDAAYEQISYEIQVSKVKKGCAENAIVNGFVELMKEAEGGPSAISEE